MAFNVSWGLIVEGLLLLVAKYVCCPLMPLTMFGVMIWDLWLRKRLNPSTKDGVAKDANSTEEN